jgi:hypothetical protein
MYPNQVSAPSKGLRTQERGCLSTRKYSTYLSSININIEDLKIDENDVIIINCLLGMKNLCDETEDIDSVRDRVMRIIKRSSRMFSFLCCEWIVQLSLLPDEIGASIQHEI